MAAEHNAVIWLHVEILVLHNDQNTCNTVHQYQQQSKVPCSQRAPCKRPRPCPKLRTVVIITAVHRQRVETVMHTNTEA